MFESNRQVIHNREREEDISAYCLLKTSLIVKEILLVLHKLLELAKIDVEHVQLRDSLQVYWPEHIKNLLDKSPHVPYVITPPGIHVTWGAFRLTLSLLLSYPFFKILMSSRRDFILSSSFFDLMLIKNLAQSIMSYVILPYVICKSSIRLVPFTFRYL